MTTRDVAQLLKMIKDKKITEDIESGIYNFSQEYVKNNNIEFLLQSIYDSKLNEILELLKHSDYIIKAITNKKIKASELAFLKPDELVPDKYEDHKKNKELQEFKKNNKSCSTTYTCTKCKKSRTNVTTKQTRSGDEPPTTFVSCLECGYSFKMN
jgi:DNA-directed RNA polymerase subunit M/transcription elongation factor TFIIS